MRRIDAGSSTILCISQRRDCVQYNWWYASVSRFCTVWYAFVLDGVSKKSVHDGRSRFETASLSEFPCLHASPPIQRDRSSAFAAVDPQACWAATALVVLCMVDMVASERCLLVWRRSSGDLGRVEACCRGLWASISDCSVTKMTGQVAQRGIMLLHRYREE